MKNKTHISVLTWLLDPFTTEVLSHLWTFEKFAYAKSDLIRIHGKNNRDRIMSSLHKLILCDLVKIKSTMDEQEITLYQYNKLSPIGSDFDKFFNQLVLVNMKNVDLEYKNEGR